VVLVLELLALLHLEVVYHLGTLVCQLDGHGDTDHAGLAVVAVAELEGDLVDTILRQTQIGHLVQHDLALLGDNVLALAPKRGEDLEVVLFLGHAQLVDDAPRQHGFAQAQQVVLVDRNLDDLVVALLLRQLLQPLDLELTLLLLSVSDPVAIDDQQLGLAVVVVLLLGQAAFEQLQEALLGDEFAVLFVEDEVLAGPVLQLGVETVGDHEYGWLLVVVDGVAHVDAHEHGLVLVGVRDQLVLLVLELHHPGREVLELAADFLDHVVHDTVQLVLVAVVEVLHVLLLVVAAELGILVAELGVVLASLLVAVELDDGGLADDLHDGALVEDVEDLEFLLERREELGDQQNDDLLVLDQGVDHLLPVFVVVVVDEHGLNLAEVAALLLLATDELVLEELDLGLHLVGLEHDGVVHPAFALELADLRVEELAVVVDVEQLVLGLDVGWVDGELLLDADHAVVDVEVLAEFLVLVALVHVLDQVVNHLDFELEVVLGLLILQPLEVPAGVCLVRQVVDLAHLRGLDLELVILALADHDALPLLLELVVLAVLEVLVEALLVVVDDFVLVVDLVVLVHPLASALVLADDQVLEVVVLHVALEFVLDLLL